MKTCRVCFELKSLDDFYVLKRNKDNRDTRCKDCVKDKLRQTYKQKPMDHAKIRNRNLWVRYKLSPKQYDILIKDGCFICGSFEKLCVDHDHECCPGKESCGKCVRGVLCWAHNVGESRFKNVSEIEKLLEYRTKQWN